jgi:hypothetical protein
MAEIKNFKSVTGSKTSTDSETKSEQFKAKYVPASKIFVDQGWKTGTH